jgi:3-hydroxybutyryl-CoA dehydrogenase
MLLVSLYSYHVGITRLGVVGSGTMGVGIAEVGLLGGCEVVVVDTEESALTQARSTLQKSLAKAASSGRLAGDAAEVLTRLTLTLDLSDLAECPIVIEAIRENVEDKIALFRALDKVLEPTAVVATNTSSIPVAKLAAATEHPGRVLGLHFFNPVPLMPLVEVIPSLLTEGWATDQTDAFVTEVMGKDVIHAKDRAGFVVNAILVPYLLSAIRSLENGVATRDDIDKGLVGGCGMPMGPLRLCDLIGLDTMLLVADCLYSEHLEPCFAAPALLRRHVDAGWLGRKTDRGFYEYDKSREPAADKDTS